MSMALLKKMLRFAADWRICIFVCNSHFHMASREKCFPTYVNFQSFHVNSSADFFCSLALNTKNQFSNCVVEPHREVGRVCSCKSWSVAEICRLSVPLPGSVILHWMIYRCSKHSTSPFEKDVCKSLAIILAKHHIQPWCQGGIEMNQQ